MKRLSLLLALLTNCCPHSNAENWPRFRGPTGQGISSEKKLPLHWTSESNVVWKAAIPGEGWSSPIVWEDRVFVTAATESGTKCHVLCLDASAGRIVWDKAVFEQTAGHKETKNSYATPTPATDGKLVYACFGDGSLVALDFNGAVIWTNREFKFYSQHGLGTSPILYHDLLIMARDGSHPPPDTGVGWHTPWNEAYVLALDKTSGKLRWKTPRGSSRLAHVTPQIMTVNGRDELISGAGDVVQAFDPEAGQKLWSIPSIGEGVVPSIVIGDGLIFSASGFGKPTIRAMKPDGNGREAAIVWEQNKSVPMVPSFLYLKPHLFAITEGGVAMCLNAATGEIVWQERVGGTFWASPVYAEGRIYFLSEAGETTVIEPASAFKVLAKNPLEGKCQASLAVSGGRLFIRTDKRLYCVATRGL